MTTSSAELIWRRALPSEGSAEVMDWRAEDMMFVVSVGLMGEWQEDGINKTTVNDDVEVALMNTFWIHHLRLYRNPGYGRYVPSGARCGAIFGAGGRMRLCLGRLGIKVSGYPGM